MYSTNRGSPEHCYDEQNYKIEQPINEKSIEQKQVKQDSGIHLQNLNCEHNHIFKKIQ